MRARFRAEVHDVLAGIAGAGARDVIAKVHGAGLLGDDAWERAILAEESGRRLPAGSAMSLTRHAVAFGLVRRFGAPSARERFLGGDVVLRASLPATATHRRPDDERDGADGPAADAWCVGAGVGEETAVFVVGDDPAVEGSRLAVTATEALAAQRVMDAWCAIGAAERYLLVAQEHCRRRHAFGSPLFRHQAVRLRLAELRAQVEGSRQLSLAALEDGGPWTAAAAMLKAGRAARRTAEECVALHGAAGYVAMHEASGFPGDAHLLSEADGRLLDELVSLRPPP